MVNLNIKDQIITDINSVVGKMVSSVPSYRIEHPSDPSHGDFSVNIAFILARELKKSPKDVAQDLVAEYTKQEYSYLDRVEVVNGFINFWLSKEFLFERMREVLDKRKQYGRGVQLKNKKVMVEYTDPNPFKEFHIGHLYSNSVGEALSRLFEAQNGEVKRASYQGDVGMHVAKSLYGILQQLKTKNLKLEDLENSPLDERVKFLGEAYVVGAKAYEEDEKAKEEMNQINKTIYNDKGEILKQVQDDMVQDDRKDIKKLYEMGRAWSLEYFETIYQRLGTQFDYYYFESEVGKIGSKLVKEYQEKGVFAESEGAVIFPGEKFGLHNRVFINSLGLPTYEAKELGLNKQKYEDYPFDLSVIVTGNEINEYFKVLLKVMEQVIPEIAKKTKHIGHGMVRLPEGKMSSRTGRVITGEWLLDEAKRKICSNFPDMNDETAEMVALAAVKYALLKSGIGQNIEFSFDESISFEGNSGPYLQYTYVRTRSVLEKSQFSNSKSQINSNDQNANVQNNLEPEELMLLRLLYRFPEVVEEASTHLAPNYICSYLFELAQSFNLFYQKHKILKQPMNQVQDMVQNDSSNDTEEFRLALTISVGQILYNGLYMLGIQSPNRM